MLERHPTDEEMEAFFRGALSPELNAEIESHLNQCPECFGPKFLPPAPILPVPQSEQLSPASVSPPPKRRRWLFAIPIFIAIIALFILWLLLPGKGGLALVDNDAGSKPGAGPTEQEKRPEPVQAANTPKAPPLAKASSSPEDSGPPLPFELVEVATLPEHKQGHVCGLQLSSDEKTLVSMDRSGEVFVRDFPSGKMRFRFYIEEDLRNHTPGEIFISPDGTRLAIAGEVPTIYDLKSGKVLSTFPKKSDRVRFTSDGKRLLTMDRATLRMWEVATGDDLWSFGTPEREEFQSVVLAKDGKTCSVTAEVGGSGLHFDGEHYQITREEKARQHDIMSGEVLKTIDFPRQAMDHLRLFDDGAHFAKLDQNGVFVHEISTRKEKFHFPFTDKGFGDSITQLNFLPAGRSMICQFEGGYRSTFKGIIVLDATTGQILAKRHSNQFPLRMTVAKDGTIVIGGSYDGIVRLWKVVPQ